MDSQRIKHIGRVASAILMPGILLVGIFLFTTASRAAGLLYVAPTPRGSADCSTWTDACSLQTALASAVDGDQIWVERGEYKPSPPGNRSASFSLKAGVQVYGGFTGDEDDLTERDWLANPTVLSGDIDNNDLTDPTGVITISTNIVGNNSYHVVTASGGITESTRLDGFAITGGSANVAAPDNSGGGMKNVNSSPVIANVIFSGNRAGEGGGMHNFQSNPLLVNVIFSGNRSCASGCGMENAESSPVLTNVVFRNNDASHGGGMLNGALSSPHLTNVLFSGNSASVNGGAINNSTNSSPILVNITFSGNNAGRYGGAIFNYWASLTMTNVVMWGNPDSSYYEISGINSTVVASYSDINYPGGYPGTGNLNQDPLFVDANGADGIPGTADDDLRLLPGSPVIDAGNNSAVPAGILADMDGNPRFVDDPSTPDTGAGTPPIVDMGAYEARFQQLNLEKEVSPTTVEPGDPITFTLTLSSTGSFTAAQIVLTDTLPAFISVSSVISSGLAITDSGHVPAYVWFVEDISPGETGVITITGVLDTPLASGDYNNRATIAYTMDSGRVSSSDTVTYTVPNLAPAFTSTPVTTATEGELYSYAIVTADLNGDALAITASALPAWLSLTDHGDGTATLAGTPATADVGDHPVTLEVEDSLGLTGSQSFTIVVARRPVIFLPIVLYLSP